MGYFSWDSQGDFTTKQPLPIIKIKLFTEAGKLLSFDDKELAKVCAFPFMFTCIDFDNAVQVQINVHPNYPRQVEWHKMYVHKSFPDKSLKVRTVIRVEKPPTLKMSGYDLRLCELMYSLRRCSL